MPMGVQKIRIMTHPNIIIVSKNIRFPCSILLNLTKGVRGIDSKGTDSWQLLLNFIRERSNAGSYRPTLRNPDSGIREIFACGIRNLRKLFLWHPKFH